MQHCAFIIIKLLELNWNAYKVSGRARPGRLRNSFCDRTPQNSQLGPSGTIAGKIMCKHTIEDGLECSTSARKRDGSFVSLGVAVPRIYT
eukprot:1149523-Pelagomonas_calceolata.AAC.4